jgi:hypothetical protein
MQYARRLLESRPFLARVPDQSLLVSDPGTGRQHIRATRAKDGSYTFIYSASGQPFVVDLRKLAGQRITAHWYDPRTGVAHRVGSVPSGEAQPFEPPTRGADKDWVLTLDDESWGFGTPGEEGSERRSRERNTPMRSETVK